MTRKTLLVAAGFAIAGLTAVPVTSTASERYDRAAQEVVPGSYIVVYKPSVSGAERETRQREGRHGFRSENRYTKALKGFSAKLSRADVAALERDPEVQSVTQTRRVHARGTLAGGELVPTGVQRIVAGTPHNSMGTGGTASAASSSAVAVIDTGIDLDHRDLNATHGKNALGSTDCAGNSAGEPSSDDDNGHGTHVAGTIGANNDSSSSGLVGVAPGTQLYAVKVLDSAGSGTDADIICGMDWVTANNSVNNIKVANMSLGGLGVGADNNPCGATTTPLHNAFCRSTQAGVRYAVAAGNDGWAFPHPTLPDTPSTYPEVVTVTASSDSNGRGDGLGGPPTCRTGEADEKYASFSNFSDNSTGDHNRHTIAAPGVCIRSTWPLNLTPSGGYHTISGTSMASPHVAGAIARCIGEEGAPTGGPCASLADPAAIVNAIQSKQESHGFCGAPNVQPVSSTRYYGYEALAGAPAPAAGFGVCMPQSSLTVRRGKSASATVNVPRSRDYTAPVSLGASGLGTGVSASFSPNNSTSASSTMTIRAASKAGRGTRTITVRGYDAGGQQHGTTFTLTVR